MIEMIGISAIMPFIAMANNTNYILENSFFNYFYTIFNFTDSLSFIFYFGLVLVFFYISRALLSAIYYFVISNFARGKYNKIAKILYNKVLHLNYLSFVNSKSSDYSKSIINEAYNFTTVITALLNILTETFVVIFIYLLMLYVDYKLTLLITIVLLVSMFFLIKVVTNRIKLAGIKREISQKSFFDIVNSTFGNYKLIKLSKKNQESLETKFKKVSLDFTKSNVTFETIAQFPRIFLEAITFLMLIGIILFLIENGTESFMEKIPVLSMLLLALYRLMPSANRILTSYGQIIYAYRSIDIVYDLYNKDIEKLGTKNIDFKKEIRLNNLSFGYNNYKSILDNVDLTIKKGEKIALIGPSGCGKSTLVDIIIGLIPIQDKSIYIDNIEINDSNIVSLRSKVGYIPQSVYLFDGTILDNIVLGNVKDEDKVVDVLKKAKIYDFLIENKDGLETNVGDGGIKFSGGQKQRIAIARALYSDPDILILDEATSGLDEHTEKEIMEEIMSISRDKTLIIIAHRLNTIKGCDKVYEINNKKLELCN
jgi:ABC-type multidrug transport system fused ATPase/permease subunit